MKVYIRQADGTYSFLFNSDDSAGSARLLPGHQDQASALIALFKEEGGEYFPLKSFEIMGKSDEDNRQPLGEIEIELEGSPGAPSVRVRDLQSGAEVFSPLIEDSSLESDFLSEDSSLESDFLSEDSSLESDFLSEDSSLESDFLFTGDSPAGASLDEFSADDDGFVLSPDDVGGGVDEGIGAMFSSIRPGAKPNPVAQEQSGPRSAGMQNFDDLPDLHVPEEGELVEIDEESLRRELKEEAKKRLQREKKAGHSRDKVKGPASIKATRKSAAKQTKKRLKRELAAARKAEKVQAKDFKKLQRRQRLEDRRNHPGPIWPAAVFLGILAVGSISAFLILKFLI